MAEVYRFNDKALDDIVQQCSVTFKSFQANLDHTSADIRSLEKWLQSCGICFYAEVSIEPGTCIAWSDSHGDWRLVCEISNGLHEDDVDSRPLIEMPVRYRLLARPHLASLVTQISALVPQVEVEPEKKKASLLGRISAAKPNEPFELDAIFNSEGKNPL